MSGNLVPFAPPAPSDAQFLAVFNRLCVALRETQDDSGITQTVYYEALKDLPHAAVEEAARKLMRESGRRFFPTTAEWRTLADLEARELLRKAVKPVRVWGLECERCEDTGWVLGLTCDGHECGRHKEHAPHTYTKPCPCRPTNRTYQRNQRFGAGAD